jgi:hypothetical protein
MVCNPDMCVEDGGTCTMDSDCCSGTCGMDASGAMVCNPTTCVADGRSCTVDGDCCPGSCCRPDSTGATVCTTDCGAACTLGALGDLCTTAADCCNSPPVVCAGLEFTTCQLP